MKKLVVCNKCGWAHFPRTEQEVRVESENFKAYFDSMPAEEKLKYYNSTHYDVAEAIEKQKQCFNCGASNQDFHEETPQDHIPMGSTIQGIIFN